jgi:signal transduction histidine kinase
VATRRYLGMVRLSSAEVRARARALPPRAVDAALASALLVEATLESAFLDGISVGSHLAAVGLAALVCAGIVIRRDHPLPAVALALLSLCLLNLLPQRIQDVTEGQFFGLLFLVYSMALRTSGRTLWAGVAMTLAGIAVAIATSKDPEPSDFLFGALLATAAPVVAGQLLQSRMRLNAALREKNERIERERSARAEEAVAEERARIAGELHDVVAHSLGAMTVQAAAARRLAVKDVDRAGSAFEAIEGTGREALTELRRLLGVLRREDDDPELGPQPTLASVEELVRSMQAAGLPVDLSVQGEPGALSAGVDLTGYRVIQEALAEALRSGGAGRASVNLRYRSDGLEIEVVDDGLRADDRKLLGMRERVRVYGGRFEAGPRRDGGHAVVAHLPLEAVA